MKFSDYNRLERVEVGSSGVGGVNVHLHTKQTGPKTTRTML